MTSYRVIKKIRIILRSNPKSARPYCPSFTYLSTLQSDIIWSFHNAMSYRMSGELPAPGSPTFVPALIAHIQAEINSGSEEWSIEPSLFSALLLSQIVGPERGGIIVDVLPTEGGEKAKAVNKVVENVQAVNLTFDRKINNRLINRYLNVSLA